MARIVMLNKTGGPEVLKIEETEPPQPGKGEVRIKVDAFGINRAEILFRQGLYLQNPEFPSRIGYEAAGIIDAVGPEVQAFEIGEKVSVVPSFIMGKYGTYGDSALLPENAVTRYPENLSPIEGAAIWMKYLTAYGALVEYGKLREGDVVLITAASSSVGLAAIQITKSKGGTAIATTRQQDKQQALLDAGADYVIVTDDADVAQATNDITHGKGARLIFDPVSGPMLERLAFAAANQGMIVEYGSLSMATSTYPFIQALAKGLTIMGYTLFLITGNPERLERGKNFVIQGLASGDLKPVIDRTFPLESIAEAHAYMESNQQIGKIVVTT